MKRAERTGRLFFRGAMATLPEKSAQRAQDETRLAKPAGDPAVQASSLAIVPQHSFRGACQGGDGDALDAGKCRIAGHPGKALLAVAANHAMKNQTTMRRIQEKGAASEIARTEWADLYRVAVTYGGVHARSAGPEGHRSSLTEQGQNGFGVVQGVWFLRVAGG